VTSPPASRTNEVGQISAVESDLSAATSASSQAQTDLDAASAAQAESDSP
jgi:hypothetical protein